MTPRQDAPASEPHCVMCSDEHMAGPCFGPGKCFAPAGDGPATEAGLVEALTDAIEGQNQRALPVLPPTDTEAAP